MASKEGGAVKLTNQAILVSVDRTESTVVDQVGVDDRIVQKVVDRIVHVTIPGKTDQHGGRGDIYESVGRMHTDRCLTSGSGIREDSGSHGGGGLSRLHTWPWCSSVDEDVRDRR